MAVWIASCVADALGHDRVRALSMMQYFTGLHAPLCYVGNIAGLECYEDRVRSSVDLRYAWSMGDKTPLHLIIYPTNALLRHMLHPKEMPWGQGVKVYVLEHPKLDPGESHYFYHMGYIYPHVRDLARAVIGNMRAGDVCVGCSTEDMGWIFNAILDESL
jgi:hypothetical protein